MSQFLLDLCYLIGSVTFIIGLKQLSSPATARKGNLVAAFGMGLAILGTILFHKNDAGQPIGNIGWILAAIAIGTVIGWMMAMRVKMTAMPQMVSLFNGMGGACAAIISIVEFNENPAGDMLHSLVIFLGLVIGSVSFAGSMVAFGKLDEKIKDLNVRGISLFNLVLLGLIVLAVGLAVYSPSSSDEHCMGAALTSRLSMAASSSCQSAGRICLS